MKLNFVIQLLGKAVPMKQSLQPKRQSPSPHHRPSLPRSFERHSYRSATIGSTLIARRAGDQDAKRDRKSTRLNSSHGYISYAVFCLKKKKILNRMRVHPTTQTRPPGLAPSL